MTRLTLKVAYETLGLEVGSDLDAVKKQYKKLALRTHPDKNKSDPEASKKFMLISESYKRIVEPEQHEDDDEHEPTEEEMEAMFNMMFADLFGMEEMSGSIPFELFDIFDLLAMEEDEEHSPFFMNTTKQKKNNKKKSKKDSSKRNCNVSDSDDWETATDDSQDHVKTHGFRVEDCFDSEGEDEVDDDLLLEMMMQQLLGVSAGGKRATKQVPNKKKHSRKSNKKVPCSSEFSLLNNAKVENPQKSAEGSTDENLFKVGERVKVYNK